MPSPLKLLELLARRNGRPSRLGVIIAQLASDNPNVRAVAALKLTNEIRSADADIHDFIAYVEEPPLNARQIALIEKAIDEKAEAIAETKRKTEAARPSFNDFSSTDGADDWREMALYVDREKHRLSPRDYNDWAREFIDDMATRARLDPSYQARPKQLVQLRKFFIRLGGKIT